MFFRKIYENDYGKCLRRPYCGVQDAVSGSFSCYGLLRLRRTRRRFLQHAENSGGASRLEKGGVSLGLKTYKQANL